MPARKTKENWYDPRQRGQAIHLDTLNIGRKPFDPARTNYFTIYLIQRGSGEFWADASRFEYGANSLLFFVPYQHIALVPKSATHGQIIQFHANFLCVETFHSEVGCSGILFNDPHGIPIVSLTESDKNAALHLIENIRQEQAQQALAYGEVMLANLKVLLIQATRLKSSTPTTCPAATASDPRHPMLIELRELIELNYRTLHSPADYAKLLHITPKTLGRIVRDILSTTPSELIRARILTHAKWQLLHTLRPVKEIARELGFVDELYFSRLFKKATGCSPTFFREFETEIRGGSNLSMFSSNAPIQSPGSRADTELVIQKTI